jgi:hypothetical protein
MMILLIMFSNCRTWYIFLCTSLNIEKFDFDQKIISNTNWDWECNILHVTFPVRNTHMVSFNQKDFHQAIHKKYRNVIFNEFQPWWSVCSLVCPLSYEVKRKDKETVYIISIFHRFCFILYINKAHTHFPACAWESWHVLSDRWSREPSSQLDWCFYPRIYYAWVHQPSSHTGHTCTAVLL